MPAKVEMRLQRFLAQAGVASRRKAEELITAGRVKVNGRVVSELGSKVDPIRDEVTLGGRRVMQQQPVYLILNKPKGYVTTLSDPEGRPTVMELVGKVEERVYPVGRLDFNTEGVLLMTNDGDLAHALMHPAGEVKKTYRVKVRGSATREQVDELRHGVTLDDGSRTAAAEVELLGPSEGGNNTWFEITIHEGKNRQIHRMAEALGLQVAKLQRVRYAGLTTEGVRPGRWRSLRRDEVDDLRRLAGMKVPTQKLQHRHRR
jgi:23S rRNA pseudouridine2605 synthase